MEIYVCKPDDDRSVYCILPETDEGYENLIELAPEEEFTPMNPVKEKTN